MHDESRNANVDEEDTPQNVCWPTKWRKTSAMLVTSLLCSVIVVGCAREKEKEIWHPLIYKYMGCPSVVQVGGDVYTQTWITDPPERHRLEWHQDVWSRDIFSWAEIQHEYHTGLSQILKNNGIVVSDAIIANDIQQLMDVIMPVNVYSEYLVESIEHSQTVWTVDKKYYGCPDDRHRRPSRIVFKIHTDSAGLLTNIVKEVHPRPMDVESPKSRSWHHS